MLEHKPKVLDHQFLCSEPYPAPCVALWQSLTLQGWDCFAEPAPGIDPGLAMTGPGLIVTAAYPRGMHLLVCLHVPFETIVPIIVSSQYPILEIHSEVLIPVKNHNAAAHYLKTKYPMSSKPYFMKQDFIHCVIDDSPFIGCYFLGHVLSIFSLDFEHTPKETPQAPPQS